MVSEESLRGSFQVYLTMNTYSNWSNLWYNSIHAYNWYRYIMEHDLTTLACGFNNKYNFDYKVIRF